MALTLSAPKAFASGIAVAIAACALIVGGYVLSRHSSQTARLIVIPNLVGETIGSASSELQGIGVVPLIAFIPTTSSHLGPLIGGPGIVTAESPVAGTRISSGSSVTLFEYP